MNLKPLLLTGFLLWSAALRADASEQPPPLQTEPATATDQLFELEPLPETSAEPPDPAPQAANPFNAPFSQQNFVPDISLILDLSAGLRNLENAVSADLTSPLMLQGKTTGHAHNFNALNGFNLNYAELTLQAPADPFLDMFATFHLSANEIEIEEAYVVSRGLPAHFQMKAGKFLSHFGRLNAQHAHFWNFSTRPAVYSNLFGSEQTRKALARLAFNLEPGCSRKSTNPICSHSGPKVRST